jgi:hypothetical protein
MRDEFSMDGELKHVSVKDLAELSSQELCELKDRCILARQSFVTDLRVARANYAAGGVSLPSNEWRALERIISWYGVMSQRAQDAQAASKKREKNEEHELRNSSRERLFIELVKLRFTADEWFALWKEVDRVEAAQRAIAEVGK